MHAAMLYSRCLQLPRKLHLKAAERVLYFLLVLTRTGSFARTRDLVVGASSQDVDSDDKSVTG